jgi:hypothetical protein
MRMRSIVTCAAALAASISATYGGPCWDDLSAVQAKIDAVLERKAADGPTCYCGSHGRNKPSTDTAFAGNR